MKTRLLFLALLAIGLLPACKKDTNHGTGKSGDLPGTYQLNAYYFGSVGGVSDYQPVTSGKNITFHADGTITSNGDLCHLTMEPGTPTSGTYSNGVITVEGCEILEYKFVGFTVILGYAGVEQSRAKFQRI